MMLVDSRFAKLTHLDIALLMMHCLFVLTSVMICFAIMFAMFLLKQFERILFKYSPKSIDESCCIFIGKVLVSNCSITSCSVLLKISNVISAGKPHTIAVNKPNCSGKLISDFFYILLRQQP